MSDKSKIILLVFGFCAFILTAKTAQLQIFSEKYKKEARRTTLDQTIKYPARGLIYDRNEKLLVSNNTIYDINVIYNNVPKNIDTAQVCTLLGIDKKTFVDNLNKNWSSPQYHKSIPFTFLTRVKPEQFSIFQEHLHKFPGFYPIERNIRTYPHQNVAHVLGFLGEVDRDDLEKDSKNIYSRGDYIGRSGIERTYEEALRGEKGIGYVLKDNLGRDVESYENGELDSDAISGSDIISTIDLDLQIYGEELMQNKLGSIVALEPSTGEILTMISSPSYDPNLLNLDRNRGVLYDSLSQDTLYKPLFDRSVMAKYPPGSLFKTVFSLIAMQKDILQHNRTIYCDGAYEVDSKGRYVQGCHQHPTPYNVSIALQHSCNSYYYQIMREFIDNHGYTTPGIGLDTLITYLKDFGLGNRLGIDYHTEERGFLPTSKFYNRLYSHIRNGWRSTYILSLGIGQGELELTTIQMANLAAILANRGYYYTPHLVKSFLKEGHNLDDEFTRPKKVRIDEQHFEPVIEGMARVTTLGTGQLAYIPGIEICGKTGTSENSGEDHSVFFAFAPRENPKIAIAVYVENAGFGGDIAAPIASLMIEKYINGEISARKQYLEEKMMNLKLINPEKDLLSQRLQ
ncbi:MAG: penicillin-binding protein 2 [Bacteroidota bacterium]